MPKGSHLIFGKTKFKTIFVYYKKTVVFLLYHDAAPMSFLKKHDIQNRPRLSYYMDYIK